MACEDRQLTEAQRQAGYQNQRTGVQQAVRPFSGRPTVDNLIDYINRELYPAVRATRSKVNDIYLPTVDNAPSGNPLSFYFSTETAAADPTTGRIRLNASPQNTATTLRVSETNARLVSVTPWLDVMAGGATSPLGVVTLTDAINPARFIRFDLNTMTDQGVYWELAVTPIESSHDDPFVNDGAVVLGFIPGVASTGATVPPGSITPIATDTFVGNISGSTAAPVAVPLADVDSASVVYDGASHTFQRAALAGGDVTAPQNSNVLTIEPNAVTDAKLRQSAGMSVIGRASNTTGNVADITMPVTTGGRFLRTNTTGHPSSNPTAPSAIGWGVILNLDLQPIPPNRFLANMDLTLSTKSPVQTDFYFIADGSRGVEYDPVDQVYFVKTGTTLFVDAGGVHREAITGDVTIPQFSNTATIAPGAVTLAKMADIAQSRFLGRSEGAGTGVPEALTPTQAVAIIDGEDATWTGAHAFTGATHTVNVTGGVLVQSSTADVGIAATTAVAASAGQTITLAGGTGVRLDTNLTQRLTIETAGAWNVGGSVGSTSHVLRSAGAGAPPSWGELATAGLADNAVTLAKLATQAAGTVLANVTAGAAAPTAHSLSTLAGAQLTYTGGVIDWDGAGIYNATPTLQKNARDLAVGSTTSIIGAYADAGGSGAWFRYERAALTGDVTAPQNSNATTIANAAVTLAKMANLAAGTVIGRQIAAGTGAPAALTGADIAEIIRFSNVVTEAVGGTLNNYNLSSLADVLRVTATATISGIANGTAGRRIVVANGAAAGSGVTVDLLQFTTSSSGNRFLLPAATNVRLHPGDSIVLQHGVAAAEWSGLNVGVRLTDGDKGDITVSASGATWTIDNAAVTSGKLASDAVDDTKLRNSGACSVIGRSANSAGDPADIAASANNRVLCRHSDTLVFDQIVDGDIAAGTISLGKITGLSPNVVVGNNTAGATNPVQIAIGTNTVLGRVAGNIVAAQVVTAQITDANVTDAKISNRTALSVFGRSANSAGVGADIAAANDGEVLRRSGTSVGFGTVATGGIANNAVTLAKLATQAANTVLANATAGAAVPTAVSIGTNTVLGRVAGNIVAAQLVNDQITDGTITFTKIGDIAGARIVGRDVGAAGGLQALTATQVMDIISAETVTWNGAHTHNHRVHWINPTSSSETAVNNKALGNTTVWALTATGAPTLVTGMVASASGQLCYIVNPSTTDYIRILPESTSSSAANRFSIDGTSLDILPLRGMGFWYDSGSARWRPLGMY